MNAPASVEPTTAVLAMTPYLRLVYQAAAPIVERGTVELAARLARLGLSPAQLEADPTLRLPFPFMCELAEMCAALLDDPATSLKAAMQLMPNDHELLDFLMASCRTLGDAIECQARYYPLLIDAELELQVHGERAEVLFRFAEGLQAPAHLYEFALASHVVKARHHVRPEGALPPLEVRLRHPAPAYADLFDAVFQCPVRFDCDDYATVLPASMLQQRMNGSNPLLHAVLLRQAERELAALPRQSALPSTVRKLLEGHLREGLTLSEAAAMLGMSASSLRSRLRECGTKYSRVLDNLRQDRARVLLRRRDLSMGEVTEQLGFTHPPALHRAVRRWFGMSPGAYREARHLHPVSEFLRNRGGKLG